VSTAGNWTIRASAAKQGYPSADLGTAANDADVKLKRQQEGEQGFKAEPGMVQQFSGSTCALGNAPQRLFDADLSYEGSPVSSFTAH
jgi:hypothetical protein